MAIPFRGSVQPKALPMPALARLQAPTPCDRFDIEARLRTGGPAALDDAEALQLLAGLSDGQSEALIAEFGSLPEALAADVAALRRVVPTDQAARLKLAADVARRLLVAPLQARSVLSSRTAVSDYLRAGLAGRTREEFRVLFLDKRNRLIRVHLAVRALSDDGVRLNPKKADLEAWRQAFAEVLCQHGVAAEATPRRARGVTRKAERTPIRKIRERASSGLGAPGKTHRAALQEAACTAFGGEQAARPWEQRTMQRQRQVRALYEAQAHLLKLSSDPEDRRLGEAVLGFVRGMPEPDTQRLALARALRSANDRLPSRGLDPSLGRSR